MNTHVFCVDFSIKGNWVELFYRDCQKWLGLCLVFIHKNEPFLWALNISILGLPFGNLVLVEG